ncbi:MAG: HAMP domain-containing sensor histidine kinase [Chloroflexota bacterium]
MLELERANKLLYRLDRMKSDFIVLASHELYTPLTLVSGYSNLMDEHLKQDDEKITLGQTREIAGLMSTSVLRMQGVVQEIMNVARIAAGRLELSIGPVKLGHLADSVYQAFEDILRLRNLSLLIEEFEVPLIFGDGAHIKTVIYNLVENAIKYTPDGGEITVKGYLSGAGVELSVHDTGIGIPLDEQKQIFSQFYTLGNVDNHSSSKSAFEGGGMGLGLTIASGIVEAHNGRIWVESRGEDRDSLPGSTFFVWLPIGSAQDAE